MTEKKINKAQAEESVEKTSDKTAKKSTRKTRANDNVSIGLRIEATALKIRKFIDNLVDAYS